ncbi:hypothetical protein Fmac_003564 [Flemingia macrophylla]|uniref:Uncharacterized protein n=1 Tax=Flemingia macrophylla TaxID=520843 RepID=A0ABD1NN51_9FABA
MNYIKGIASFSSLLSQDSMANIEFCNWFRKLTAAQMLGYADISGLCLKRGVQQSS